MDQVESSVEGGDSLSYEPLQSVPDGLIEEAFYNKHAIDTFKAMIREDVADFEVCYRSGVYSNEELDVIAESCKRRTERWTHNIDLLKTTLLTPNDVVDNFPPVMLDT